MFIKKKHKSLALLRQYRGSICEMKVRFIPASIINAFPETIVLPYIMCAYIYLRYQYLYPVICKPDNDTDFKIHKINQTIFPK